MKLSRRIARTNIARRKKLAARDGKAWYLVEQTKRDYPELARNHPEAAAAVKAEWGRYW